MEDGEIIHEQIELFAQKENVLSASVIVLGGVDKDSILVVGPRESRATRITPQELILDDTHEATGTGSIFPDENGQPKLHLHISCGRNEHSYTGCAQKGVKVWHVLEVIVTELEASKAKRLLDETTGFKLLQPTGSV